MASRTKRKSLPRTSEADPEVVHARDAEGRAICGANDVRKGVRAPCPEHGAKLDSRNGRCDRHGGKAIGFPVKHGRYADGAWGQLGKLVEQAAGKGPPTSLTEPLFALEAVLQRYGQIAAENDSPEFRERALELMGEMLSAPDEDRGLATLRLKEHLERGANETRALEGVRDTAAILHQRAEAYQRHRLAKQNSLAGPQAVALLAGIFEIVKKHASPEVAAAITLDVRGRVLSSARALEPVIVGA